MEMSAQLFLALFAAIGVSLSEGVCRGEAEVDGKRSVKVVLPENCWYFCQRYYNKGGECESNTEDARCICDGSGLLVDVGACHKEQGQDDWITNCDEYCRKDKLRYGGGECMWTWSSFSRRCYCRNHVDDLASFKVPR